MHHRTRSGQATPGGRTLANRPPWEPDRFCRAMVFHALKFFPHANGLAGLCVPCASRAITGHIHALSGEDAMSVTEVMGDGETWVTVPSRSA